MRRGEKWEREDLLSTVVSCFCDCFPVVSLSAIAFFAFFAVASACMLSLTNGHRHYVLVSRVLVLFFFSMFLADCLHATFQ